MNSFEDFKKKLDNEHKWPTTYMFKFIVPSAKFSELKAIFPQESLNLKSSKNGKYTSFTLNKYIKSSDEIIEIYFKAQKIKGLIAL